MNSHNEQFHVLTCAIRGLEVSSPKESTESRNCGGLCCSSSSGEQEEEEQGKERSGLSSEPFIGHQ